MSAIGSTVGSSSDGKGFAISAYADIRHAHLCFERQQSLAFRDLEWEDRVEPLLPWSALLLRGAIGLALVLAVLAMLI